MFYEVAQQQEALWPQLDLSIAAAQGTAPEIERISRKTIGFLADRLHRLAPSLREIGQRALVAISALFPNFCTPLSGHRRGCCQTIAACSPIDRNIDYGE